MELKCRQHTRSYAMTRGLRVPDVPAAAVESSALTVQPADGGNKPASCEALLIALHAAA
jgi:hypothetical protein